jgi:hypothetical protein
MQPKVLTIQPVGLDADNRQHIKRSGDGQGDPVRINPIGHGVRTGTETPGARGLGRAAQWPGAGDDRVRIRRDACGGCLRASCRRPSM